ncbi:MAG: PTS sugar transporter subunit IIA [bacterium]|nr:PTS sugar transporter subunit IIA [bacterium]
MKLYSLLNENHVLIDEPAKTLEEAFRRMLQAFGDAIEPGHVDDLVDELIAREQQHPTEIDEAVCLPHMRLDKLERFLVGLLVPEQPIPQKNEGGQPISLIFMILAPRNKNTMMLQTMAAIARLLKSKKIKQAMIGVRSAGRLIRLIEDSGIDVKKTLVAQDIMSPITHQVTANTILAKAVDLLVDAPDEGIPVVNDHGKLIGELTSRELLTLGMPKYLDLIVNPGMLDSFEPFENFFQNENTMTVREVCRRDVITVEPNTSIVQVTHLMMTAHKRRIYVIEEDDLKGIIYRKSIVVRVLHF